MDVDWWEIVHDIEAVWENFYSSTDSAVVGSEVVCASLFAMSQVEVVLVLGCQSSRPFWVSKSNSKDFLRKGIVILSTLLHSCLWLSSSYLLPV